MRDILHVSGIVHSQRKGDSSKGEQESSKIDREMCGGWQEPYLPQSCREGEEPLLKDSEGQESENQTLVSLEHSDAAQYVVYIANALEIKKKKKKLIVEYPAASQACFRKHICCSLKVMINPDGAVTTKMTRMK